MNKLFTLLALVGLGISMVGCAGESAAPPPAETPAATTPAEGATPAPEAPPAEEKKE